MKFNSLFFFFPAVYALVLPRDTVDDDGLTFTRPLENDHTKDLFFSKEDESKTSHGEKGSVGIQYMIEEQQIAKDKELVETNPTPTEKTLLRTNKISYPRMIGKMTLDVFEDNETFSK